MGELFKKVFKGDFILWITIGLLLLVSSIEMFSAISQEAFRRSNHLAPFFSHIQMLGLGLIAMIIVHRFPYRYIRGLNYLILPIALVLLVLLPFIGVEANNAIRAIKVLGFEFQPLELAKFSTIVFISDMLARNQKEGQTADKAFWPIISVLGIFCLLIAPQNLSTAVMLFGVGILLMMIGRISFAKLGITIGVLAALLLSLYVISHYFQPQFLGRLNTWVGRIDDFVSEINEPSADKTYVITDDNMQIMHSKIAIAHGMTPAGPGNSTQRDFLPLAFSDFIYAIVIEEYGLAGGIFIMLLYLIILFRSGRIATQCDKAYPTFMVVGLSLLIVIQAFISMAVASHLGPVTGQPLPLISRGGTSIIMTSVYLGIILNISQYIKKEEKVSNNTTNAPADEAQNEVVSDSEDTAETASDTETRQTDIK
ncbi:MAG: FtsW/RodA/SpoVE family cell cycle protein [Bacteroidales bacterium]|jgi:cell division protein FtsW|nr:FtsW/RodA/SpoVE family cell cycle protein [Bacteroidales bacterium]